MFGAIARFDIRFRWLIVAVWIGGVLAGTRLLPNLTTVTESSNATYLTAASPSVQAASLAEPFQGSTAASIRQGNSPTAIIVAYRASGPLTAADQAALGRVENAARRVPGVAAVGAGGVSADGKAAQALVTATAAAARSDAGSANVVNGVRAAFARAGTPAELSFHLTGPLAAGVDASNTHASTILGLVLIFVIVLLFVVYRALLAPLMTLIPAALSLQLAQPLLAAAGQAGLPLIGADQQLLIVLVIGVGTDYGLFLTFRFREQLARGAAPRDALVTAVARVGEAITYSGLTVAAALLALLAASFAIYRGMGPALAIGVGVTLAASLTLTPALLAIFGRAAFWPLRPRPGSKSPGIWGRVAGKAVAHPVATLCAGIMIFGALAAGLVGYRTAGQTSSAPAGSDSAAGQAVLAAHFPRATSGAADQLLLRYALPVWDHPSVLSRAQRLLAGDPVFASVAGPLGPGRGSLSAAQLSGLRARLGPAAALPPSPPSSAAVPAGVYQAYRATAEFISPDGRTVQYDAALRAGPAGSAAAAGAIPQARNALAAAARTTGAQAHGVAGQDAAAYDITTASSTSIAQVIPIVLALILILLGLLLRSLVAPWYLAITVGLSYLATLGFAMIVFVHLGSDGGLLFLLPLLLFVFSMALGEDYNILVMSRIREEARQQASLRDALTHAIGITGGTVTSAGLILAGTFTVLGLAPGGGMKASQIGFAVAFGVLLDTFFVRTLLVPSIAILLGRWNWWPSQLSRPPAASRSSAPTRRAGV
jgi:putative drug exporter of the RND superfamily